MRKILCSGGIQTHIPKEAGALIQSARLRGHIATPECFHFVFLLQAFSQVSSSSSLISFLPTHLPQRPSLTSAGEQQQQAEGVQWSDTQRACELSVSQFLLAVYAFSSSGQ